MAIKAHAAGITWIKFQASPNIVFLLNVMPVFLLNMVFDFLVNMMPVLLR